MPYESQSCHNPLNSEHLDMHTKKMSTPDSIISFTLHKLNKSNSILSLSIITTQTFWDCYSAGIPGLNQKSYVPRGTVMRVLESCVLGYLRN